MKFKYTNLVKAYFFLSVLVASVANAQDVHVWAEGKIQNQDNSCTFVLSALNRSNKTITTMPSFAFYDKKNTLISLEYVLFQNVRPNAMASNKVFISNAQCNEIGVAKLRAINSCHINGEYNFDCPINFNFNTQVGILKITN